MMNAQNNPQLLSWPEVLAATRPTLDALVQRLRRDAEPHDMGENMPAVTLPLLDRQELLRAATHLLQVLDRCQTLLSSH
jgi:hypothetical protein